MRTTTIMDKDMHEWTLHHDGDYSGPITFQVFPSLVDYDDRDTHRGVPPRYNVQIPMEVLVELVGRYLADRETNLLEDEMGVAFLDRVTGRQAQ